MTDERNGQNTGGRETTIGYERGSLDRTIQHVMRNNMESLTGIASEWEPSGASPNEARSPELQIADEGHTLRFNNGGSIQFGTITRAEMFISDTHRNEWNHRSEWEQPKHRYVDHYEDVMVNYTVPKEYADHVNGAIKIMADLIVSACSVSHLLVPGHVYVEFTLLKHRIGPESTGQIINDIQKWHAFLSYMYAVQKGYEPLLWEKTISISDQKIVAKNNHGGVDRQFKQMKAFYESKGFKWKIEEVTNEKQRPLSTNSRFSSVGHVWGGFKVVMGYSFLNIYELLEKTEDRAEFATMCGMFSEKKHGDISSQGNMFYELATGKGVDIETHHFVVIKDRRSHDVENMFFRRISPAKQVNFDLSDNNKECWEQKTRKMISTNGRKENQFILSAPRSFKGVNFTHE